MQVRAWTVWPPNKQANSAQSRIPIRSNIPTIPDDGIIWVTPYLPEQKIII